MLARLALAAWLLVVSAALAVPAHANPKYAAIVLDHATGEVLHSRRADVPLYPASLTKMMTLHMLFDALDSGRLRLDSRLPVSRRAAGMPASKLGLKAGSTITVEQAIEAMTVKSANDVAVVIAEALGGSEREFAALMTRRGREIGLRRTTFRNASGLPDREQKSTAADMAQLAQRLIRHHQRYYPYFSRRSFAFNGVNHRGHNRLLVSYPGMDGLKTGYTRASGFNLAATALRNGQRVIVVVFGGRTVRSRDDEVERLLNLGFERLRQRRPAPLIAALPRAKPGTAVLTADRGLDAIRPEAGPGSGDAAPELAQALLLPELRPGTLPVPPEPRPGTAVSVLDALPPAELAVAGAAAPPRLSAAGTYAVQVGAFHDPDKARRAAQTAAGLLPQLLAQGDIDVTPLQGRRQIVYRARVGGFDRDMADRACRLLQTKRQDCFVVQTRTVELANGTS